MVKGKSKAKSIEAIAQTELSPIRAEAETAKELRVRLQLGKCRIDKILDYHIARGELRVERQMRVNRAGMSHPEIVYWIEPKA